MAHPPLVSGREVVSALRRAGYVVVGQRGSHIKLVHSSKHIILIVPNHLEVDRWTLRGILKSARLTPEEFISLL